MTQFLTDIRRPVVYRCSSQDVTDVIERLPDIPCRFAKLFCSTVDIDTGLTSPVGGAASSLPSDAADAQELFWGFGGDMFAQLFAGEQTEWFPLDNMNQIFARSASGKTRRIFYAWME